MRQTTKTLTIVGDTSSTQRQIRQIWDRLSLRPREMPPDAILCVRHFHDPAPGQFPKRATERVALRRWRYAAEKELTRLYRRAYAPARQYVPPSADAVVFHDELEWLICLTRDWLRGALNTHWWWQHWTATTTPSITIEQAWLAHSVQVPHVLASLTATERIAAATRFSITGIERLTIQLVRMYGLSSRLLPKNRSHLASYEQPSSTSTIHNEPSIRWSAAANEPANNASVQADRLHDTLDWLPEPALLSGNDRIGRFLIIALAILYRPNLARASAFPAIVDNYLRRLTNTATSGDTSNRLPESQDAPTTEASSYATQSDSRITEDEATSNHHDAEDITTEKTPDRITTHIPDSIGRAAGRATHDNFTGDSKSVDSHLQSIETAYGGLFYVINLAVYLGIYGDFTTPRDTGLSLSLWDFLSVLAEAWFGEAWLDDPLCTWLAYMAGHDTDVFSLATLSDDEAVAPADWHVVSRGLHAFDPSVTVRWRIVEERLGVWHPAGFWLLDVPVASGASETVENLLRPYNFTQAPQEDESLQLIQTSGWERWFGWLRLYLDARLRRAFAFPDDSETHNPAVTLCRYPATVRWTQTQIDVHFSLYDINLAVRSAGLDRNPGWVPAAGYSIRFHYDGEPEDDLYSYLSTL